MAATDWEFVFDGVVGFLTSPIWQIPVMNFIEKNCIVFDPSEENCLPWGDIHKDYKKLVEDLLSSYLKDVGIKEEHFVQACSSPSVQNRPRMQVVFEQIWAAEDFEIFKRMMVQRNIELELQALHLIQHQQQQLQVQNLQTQHQQPKEQQKTKQQQQPKEEESRRPRQEQQQQPNEQRDVVDDKILKEILEMSKKEFEASEKEHDKEAIEMGKHWAETHEENVKILTEKAEEKRNEMKKVVTDRVKNDDEKKADKIVQTKLPPKQEAKLEKLSGTKELPKGATAVTEKPKTAAEAASSWLLSAKAESQSKATTATSASSSSESDDLKRREEYLKEQRDRLLQLKSKEREKQLDTYAKSQPKRPTSARVARQAIAGASESEATEDVEPKRLAMRKALADRLKKEVVYK